MHIKIIAKMECQKRYNKEGIASFVILFPRLLSNASHCIITQQNGPA